ncbi:hypothetical protein LIER_01907 [Lithospermum erythrorhizon]|uniref:Retrovirus-related Pol polyprotein from transposon TNT 1-94 n=1 Tax=Lithospermum erythrorhizon TaxID=34254 RepID=A0AAV3NSB8_LITER
MSDSKPVSTPLASHFRLSKDQSPQAEEDKYYMAKVPYASAIGNLIYAMVCIRPDIGHAVGVVSRYMSNPGKFYWEAIKWILRELGFKQENNVLYSYSQSAIHLAKNSAFHARTKHIGLRYHFIRSLLENEVLTLGNIQGAKNSADMLTKTVTINKLKMCSTLFGLHE